MNVWRTVQTRWRGSRCLRESNRKDVFLRQFNPFQEAVFVDRSSLSESQDNGMVVMPTASWWSSSRWRRKRRSALVLSRGSVSRFHRKLAGVFRKPTKCTDMSVVARIAMTSRRCCVNVLKVRVGKWRSCPCAWRACWCGWECRLSAVDCRISFSLTLLWVTKPPFPILNKSSEVEEASKQRSLCSQWDVEKPGWFFNFQLHSCLRKPTDSFRLYFCVLPWTRGFQTEMIEPRSPKTKIKCSLWNRRPRILENKSFLLAEKTKTLEIIGHALRNSYFSGLSWSSSCHFHHVCLLQPQTHPSFPKFVERQIWNVQNCSSLGDLGPIKTLQSVPKCWVAVPNNWIVVP